MQHEISNWLVDPANSAKSLRDLSIETGYSYVTPPSLNSSDEDVQQCSEGDFEEHTYHLLAQLHECDEDQKEVT